MNLSAFSIWGGFAPTASSSLCYQLLQGTICSKFMLQGAFPGSSLPTLGSGSEEPLVYYLFLTNWMKETSHFSSVTFRKNPKKKGQNSLGSTINVGCFSKDRIIGTIKSQTIHWCSPTLMCLLFLLYSLSAQSPWPATWALLEVHLPHSCPSPLPQPQVRYPLSSISSVVAGSF